MLVFVIVFVVMALIVAYLVVTAPSGWEDESGFHYGLPPFVEPPDTGSSGATGRTDLPSTNPADRPSSPQPIAGHASMTQG